MSAAYDAVVAGGGLAGSAFALRLARAGRRVALIERTRTPKPKVCGDFLSAEALTLLQRLDVDLAKPGGHRIETFRIACGTAQADAPLGFAGLGFTRLRLDEILLSACVREGVELLRGLTVSGLDTAGAPVRIRAGRRKLDADCAALASGKLNVRGLPRHSNGPAAYKMTFVPGEHVQAALGGVVQLALYSGGYLGACLVEEGGMTLCWIADGNLVRATDGDWRRQLDVLARGSDAIANLLEGASPNFDRPATVAGLPFGYMRRDVIAPDVYPVGDQLAVIPPLAGDGTSIALKSGLDAADAMLRGETAGTFQRRFLKGLRSQFGWAVIVQSVFSSEFGRRLAPRSVGALPGLATWLSRRTRLAGV
ncbi:NAD(P)/FAD-dependent oxidoreductase [Tepidamorphus sp. 3E244]|uniref:NAD(P)/FAD-dependent oxidoreductase n=1 Tax=Tepidamorphus sp. 3E244 TaxID=3385498 RepID=UPI0038FCCC38